MPIRTGTEDLRYKCPHCNTALAPFPFMRYATELRRRTCRRCKQTWLLKVTPKLILNGNGVVSFAEFTAVE